MIIFWVTKLLYLRMYFFYDSLFLPLNILEAFSRSLAGIKILEGINCSFQYLSIKNSCIIDTVFLWKSITILEEIRPLISYSLTIFGWRNYVIRKFKYSRIIYRHSDFTKHNHALSVLVRSIKNCPTEEFHTNFFDIT